MRFLRICAFCILLWTGSSALSQQSASSAAAATNTISGKTENLTHATQLIKAAEFKEALVELDALAAQQPEPSGVEHLRGFAYFQLSEMNKAEVAFRKAIGQDPQDRESRQMLGITLYRLGRPAEAIPILEAEHSSAKMSNDDPSYLLSMCYIDVQRYDDARRAMAAEYGFPADSAAAYLLTARILVRREYMVPAEAAARKALEFNPRLPLAHELLGQIDLAKIDIDQAIVEFQRERTLNPLHATVYERLGDAYFRAGDYELARQSLDRAVLLDPNSTGPYILLGKVLMKQNDSLMAAGYLQRALRMDPSNYLTHYLLGQAYHFLGRAQEASSEFQKAEQMRFGSASESVQVQ